MALKPKSFDLGMHTEKLTGRTQQRFFTPDEEENFLYPTAFDVDFNKRAEFDADKLSATTDIPAMPKAMVRSGA